MVREAVYAGRSIKIPYVKNCAGRLRCRKYAQGDKAKTGLQWNMPDIGRIILQMQLEPGCAGQGNALMQQGQQKDLR